MYLNHEERTYSLYAFVFPYPEISGTYGYYEHGGTHLYESDGFFVYKRYETYADSSDIHDHGHDDYSVEIKYDYNNHVLYYPE